MRRKINTSEIKIIGGQWRGRNLVFPEIAELRPTPNRVRETLFNWLQMAVQDAYCLDLFAGSGALGFEALSRGAKHVVMVDKSPVVIEQLRANSIAFNATNVTLYQAAVTEELVVSKEPFDIIFLDPPFKQNLIATSCELLEKQKLITPNTYIYIEAESDLNPLPIPSHWQIIKSGKTQQIQYHLLQQNEP